MKNMIRTMTVAAAACIAPIALLADPATPDPLNPRVETQLQISIDQDTDGIHFIQDNADPDIITKTYVLKHADPYEIRPYLRSALGAERISGGTSKVEAIKYNDGTGILMVSAEDYKFDKEAQNGGNTIDEIVEMLDQPKITSSSGKGNFLYFPKYRRSQDLANLLQNVGMSVANSAQENLRGKDNAFVDGELNAIWFYVQKWSIKNIREMIEVLDRPIPEVKVRYTIYELVDEGDGKLGVDYQAWKNGPGRDIFSAANRYSHGWDTANNLVNWPDVNSSHTNFIKFSPKWNTRFLDFLAAKGKAAVMTSGTLSMQNVEQGTIQVLTQIPSFAPTAAGQYGDMNLLGYARYEDVQVRRNGNLLQVDTDNDGVSDIDIEARDFNNYPISVSNAAWLVGDLLVSQVNDGNRTYYYMRLGTDLIGQGVTFFRVSGPEAGALSTSIRCRAGDFGDVAFATDRQYTIQRDDNRDTDVNNLAAGGDRYGFVLQMTPSITGESTTMTIDMSNTSLIGFENDGNPRIERTAMDTRVMVNNAGSRFVIGGLSKKDVVRSVSKLPFIGSIPVIGWALSSESEVTKKAQLVAVIDCVPVMPETTVSEDIIGQIKTVEDATADAGKKNKYGFDQWLLDQEK